MLLLRSLAMRVVILVLCAIAASHEHAQVDFFGGFFAQVAADVGGFVGKSIVPEINKGVGFLKTKAVPELAKVVSDGADFIQDKVNPELDKAFAFVDKLLLPQVSKAASESLGAVHGVLPPEVQKALADAGIFVEKNIVPELERAASAGINFVEENIIPELGRAVKFAEENIAPVVGKTLANASGLVFDTLPPELQRALTEVAAFFETDIAPEIEKVIQWTIDNPSAAGSVGLAASMVMFPGWATGPALSALGFRSHVVKGSLAANWQSGFPHVPAGSHFAELQSAGAGGYGEAIVQRRARGLGAAFLAAQTLRHRHDLVDLSRSLVDSILYCDLGGSHSLRDACVPCNSPLLLFSPGDMACDGVKERRS
ncbi:hypothetical protein MAPG_02024 [Magnaporthiopsis poae ATCC 64411]|uniref:Uncharacterized protein n=1 Tax=Magnaporthiopsis poae (strain ATCC 64411 / 73-15) TaxID=644358 RepID=A0A0C4DQ86_MAGP6|nr:hypothetical protein MAPG_02024 [Magnaporthiopsis poae ATCC 64411]